MSSGASALTFPKATHSAGHIEAKTQGSVLLAIFRNTSALSPVPPLSSPTQQRLTSIASAAKLWKELSAWHLVITGVGDNRADVEEVIAAVVELLTQVVACR